MGWLHDEKEYEVVFHGGGTSGIPKKTAERPTLEEGVRRLLPLLGKKPQRMADGEVIPMLEDQQAWYNLKDEIKTKGEILVYAETLVSALLRERASYVRNWEGGGFIDNCASISTGSKNPIIGVLVLALLGNQKSG